MGERLVCNQQVGGSNPLVSMRGADGQRGPVPGRRTRAAGAAYQWERSVRALGAARGKEFRRNFALIRVKCLMRKDCPGIRGGLWWGPRVVGVPRDRARSRPIGPGERLLKAL